MHRELDLGSVKVAIEIMNERLDPAIGHVVKCRVVSDADRRAMRHCRRWKSNPAGVDAIDRKSTVIDDRDVRGGETKLTPALVTMYNSASKAQRRGMLH